MDVLLAATFAFTVLIAAGVAYVLWLLGGLAERLTALEAQGAVEQEIARQAQAQRQLEAAEQEQKRAPVHHINPARRLSGDLWVIACSCGWTSAPCTSSSDALDEAEKHKANMPQRRVS